jgi:hypothetical protein
MTLFFQYISVLQLIHCNAFIFPIYIRVTINYNEEVDVYADSQGQITESII